MFVPNGSGAVIPGSPVASLPAGRVTVTIESAAGENDGLVDADGNPAVSEHTVARCVYPDGFVKHHQVKNAADLVAKITAQLRNRYGVTGNINVTTAPELTAGAVIELEV